MAWIVLLLSAGFEAVWATALGYSDGFRNPIPTVVFAVTVVISMLGLGWAAKTIPIGTAYAVWTGIGAVGTAIAGILFFHESASAARLVCITLIIAGVAGLKFLAK